MKMLTPEQYDVLVAAQAERDRLLALINKPENDHFLRGVHVEAVHQVERWGEAHDRAKRPADWFWLVGYLAGKALHSAISCNTEKALHHCISTAAALYNWHCAIKGVDVRMCPGRSDVAEIVDAAFPGEAPVDEYQKAEASADRALAEFDASREPQHLELLDGTKVDVRAPWPLRPVGAGDGNTYVGPEIPVRVDPD